LALITVGALVVGGALAFVTLRSARTAAPAPAAEATAIGTGTTPEPATAAGSAASTAGQQPPRSLLALDVESTPKRVRVHIDGREVGRTPYSDELPADGEEHELRFEAEGYETEIRTVRFDKNLHVVVELQKASPGSVPVAAPRVTRPAKKTDGAEPKSTAQPQPTAETPGLSGGPGKPKKRELDSSDPWAK
jgi:hypothetical protein